MGLCLYCGGGLAMLLFPMLAFPFDMDLFSFLLVFGFSSMFFAMGILSYMASCSMMPFRIYRKGFTLTSVSMRKGLREREELVTWDRLLGVSVEEKDIPMGSFKYIEMKYLDRKDMEKEENLFYVDIEDPLQALMALWEVVPDKMSASTEQYVGPGTEDMVISVPSRGKAEISDPSKMMWLPIAMVLGMGTLFTLMFPIDSDPLFLIAISWGVPMLMMVFMVGLMASTAKRNQEALLYKMSNLMEDRITYPTPFLLGLFLDVRPYLPLGEVRMVRKTLEPRSYGHQAMFETLRGERIYVDYSIYNGLEGRPGFRRDGLELVNEDAVDRAGPPMAKLSKARTSFILVLTLLYVPALGTLNAYLGGSLSMDDTMCLDYMMIGMIVFMAGFMPWMVVSQHRRSRMYKLKEGFEATPSMIRIPKAKKDCQEIGCAEVVGIRTHTRRFGNFMTLETTKGTLRLPVELGDELMSAGYRVEDELNLVQRGT